MDPDTILDRRRLKRRLVFWRVVSAAAVALLIAVSIGKFVGLGEIYVARLSIAGFIAEDRERSKAIEKLISEDDAAAVIVRINSPGGTTTGSEQIYHGLRRLAELKPVVAVIGTIGASGGYIVAIAADHIVARETSLTGSIGILFQAAEITSLLEKIGIKPFTLKSGTLKGQPSPFEPVTDEVRNSLAILLADSFDWFSNLVQQRRNLDELTLEAATDGRIFSGRQAVKLKLIDAIGGERTARKWLKEKHGIDYDIPTREIFWGEKSDLIARMLDIIGGKLFKNKGVAIDGLLSVWRP